VGKGNKLLFDDEGNAYVVNNLLSEAEFLAQGSPEEMKRQFVEETSKKMEKVDQEDRETAKEKRQLKRLRRLKDESARD